MTLAADTQESLEAPLKDEIIRMYQEIAENPSGEYAWPCDTEERIRFECE